MGSLGRSGTYEHLLNLLREVGEEWREKLEKGYLGSRDALDVGRAAHQPFVTPIVPARLTPRGSTVSTVR